jgi:hypothetical protein
VVFYVAYLVVKTYLGPEIHQIVPPNPGPTGDSTSQQNLNNLIEELDAAGEPTYLVCEL